MGGFFFFRLFLCFLWGRRSGVFSFVFWAPHRGRALGFVGKTKSFFCRASLFLATKGGPRFGIFPVWSRGLGGEQTGSEKPGGPKFCYPPRGGKLGWKKGRAGGPKKTFFFGTTGLPKGVGAPPMGGKGGGFFFSFWGEGGFVYYCRRKKTAFFGKRKRGGGGGTPAEPRPFRGGRTGSKGSPPNLISAYGFGFFPGPGGGDFPKTTPWGAPPANVPAPKWGKVCPPGPTSAGGGGNVRGNRGPNQGGQNGWVSRRGG